MTSPISPAELLAAQLKARIPKDARGFRVAELLGDLADEVAAAGPERRLVDHGPLRQRLRRALLGSSWVQPEFLHALARALECEVHELFEPLE